jgi:hypothetical protein
MSLAVAKNPTAAQYCLEVFFRRNLDLLGLDEYEQDYESLYLHDYPTQKDIDALVPDGWELVSSAIIPLALDFVEDEPYAVEDDPMKDSVDWERYSGYDAYDEIDDTEDWYGHG